MSHPDYLGHTEFISDANGDPYQYFWYSPFGDAIVEEHANNASFSSSYLFNAKELDPETGKYYYGARYYDPGLSLWLSVDPLAVKYPSSSPYVFAANNPIVFTDPDGREVKYAGIKEWFDVQMSRLFSKGFREQFNELKDSENEVYTYKYNGKSSDAGTQGDIEYRGYNEDRQETFDINYKRAKRNDYGGLGRSSKHILFEETFHAADYASGRNPKMRVSSADADGCQYLGAIQGDRSSEVRAWIFAAKNAPFVPSVVDVTDTGTNREVRFINPLVRRMRSAKPSDVENWLYGQYWVDFAVPETGETGITRFNGPYYQGK